jgi:hypothetical protein
MTALGVGDLVNVSSFPAATGPILSRPCVTSYLAAAYANVNRLPNCVITFSDGVRGYFYGGFVAAADPLAQTWNNASAQREYGNLIQLPFPVKVYGVIAGLNATADVSFNLYSNPLVSPVAEKTVSIDLNQVGAVSALAVESILFPTPYLAAANQPLAIVATPTTVTSVTMYYKTFPLSLHQASESGSGYAVSRPASGGFTAQNANKDRYAIGLLIGAFDNGAGGGSIGYPASRSYNG